jgi:hypothetical protein
MYALALEGLVQEDAELRSIVSEPFEDPGLCPIAVTFSEAA